MLAEAVTPTLNMQMTTPVINLACPVYSSTAEIGCTSEVVTYCWIVPYLYTDSEKIEVCSQTLDEWSTGSSSGMHKMLYCFRFMII